MSDYLPEGMRTTAAGLSRQQILQAVGQPKILEARAVLCVFVVFVVYKPLDRLLESLPKKAMKTIAIVLACWIAADMLLTLSALVRYSARAHRFAAHTALGELIDRVFGDAFMKRRFPAMKF